MNLQELHTKLLEEFKHVGWLGSCEGSCQAERKPQKSSDSGSCLGAGSPRVLILHRHLHCTAITGVLSRERRLFRWDLCASSWLSGSEANRKLQLCSVLFYSNSHSALWIFCNSLFQYYKYFRVKRRCCKAWHVQLCRRDQAQLKAALHRAAASRALLVYTEIKIPQKLVVLVTLLRKDWKVQCIRKTIKDKHRLLPSFCVLVPTNLTLRAGFRSEEVTQFSLLFQQTEKQAQEKPTAWIYTMILFLYLLYCGCLLRIIEHLP